ncbi:hypothetical protein [Alkalilimnicola ehrlichii]|uniref:hypothetical protein n=1 Tax=Alkalilimnicola ehrlichii TaxID=351052 RepID=UPI0021636351|nr:hypothetical protein [Alkalilimnicola ehrlichii]
MSIPVPAAEVAEAWLRELEGGAEAVRNLPLAGGAPLQALQYAESGMAARYEHLLAALQGLRSGQADPVAVAADWQGERAVLVELLLRLVSELIGGQARPVANNAAILELGQGLDLLALHDYLDTVFEAKRHIAHPLNDALAAEQLFIDWTGLCRRSRIG